MLINTSPETIVKHNSIPKVYIRSVETQKNENILKIKLYFYLLDHHIKKYWINNEKELESVNIKFKIISNKNEILIEKKFNISSLVLQNTNKLDSTTTIDGEKYFIFIRSLEISLPIDKIKITGGGDIEYSFFISSQSFINDVFKTNEEKIYVKSKNNSSVLLLDNNKNVYINEAVQRGTSYYNKYDFSENFSPLPVYNTLIKNFDLLNVEEYSTNTKKIEKLLKLNFFKTTETGHGNIKGIFTLDFEQIVKENVFFYNIYDLDKVKNIILKSIPFKVSVIRNKIIKKYNNLSGNDINTIESKEISSYNSETNLFSGRMKRIYGLSEYYNKETPNKYITFSFNDYDIASLEGTFYYTLKFTLRDNSLKTYNDYFIKKSDNTLSLLKDYKKDATEYLLDNQNGFLNDNFYNEKFIKKYSKKDYNISDTVESIVSLYKLLYGGGKEVKEFFISCLNPLSCNIENISKVVDFYEKKIHFTLSRYRGLAASKILQSGTETLEKNRAEEITNIFDVKESIIDKKTNGIGLDFTLGIPSESIKDYESGSMGIIELTTNQILARERAEAVKYGNVSINNSTEGYTFSPLVFYSNYDTSFSPNNSGLELSDYNNMLADLISKYKNINEFFNRYQSILYQLSQDGIYLKNIFGNPRPVNGSQSADRDTVFDYSNSTKDFSKKYIEDTRIYDLYNIVNFNNSRDQIKKNIKDYSKKTIQYNFLSSITSNEGNDDPSDLGKYYFDYLNLSKLNLFNTKKPVTDFDIFSEENFKYSICSFEDLVVKDDYLIKDINIYNKLFLIKNDNTADFTGASIVETMFEQDEILKDAFFSLDYRPEHIRTYIEQVKIESVDKNTYFADLEDEEKNNYLYKSI